MKKLIAAVTAVLLLILTMAACEKTTSAENQTNLGDDTALADRDAPGGESKNEVMDMDYYLGFDEGVYAIDTTVLVLETEDNLVKMQEPDMADATYGLTITFETDAHLKPVKINYYNGALVCTVTYYNYPAREQILYYDGYYSETEGDWDGNATYVREETTYYENGQVKSHILRDVADETVFVVSEEYYDEDGNSIENAD